MLSATIGFLDTSKVGESSAPARPISLELLQLLVENEPRLKNGVDQLMSNDKLVALGEIHLEVLKKNLF